MRIKTSGNDDPELRRMLMRELASMLLAPASGTGTKACWVSAVARSGDDRLQGGLIGLVTGAWLSIDLIWLRSAMRRQGYGSRLLAAAERQAADLGCLGAYVGTTSEDACAFYRSNGYDPKLVLPEIAPGVTQTVLRKMF